MMHWLKGLTHTIKKQMGFVERNDLIDIFEDAMA